MTCLRCLLVRVLVTVTVCLLHQPVAFCQTRFVRGDCNADGQLDISDPVRLLVFNFVGSVEPSCLDACDANDDASLDISDAVAMLSSLFGNPPIVLPLPNPTCGPDPTDDPLNCVGFDCP